MGFPIFYIQVPVIPHLNIKNYLNIVDIFLHNRIIFIGQYIDDEVANCVIACLMTLEIQDETREIKIYINSIGSSVYAALAIVDILTRIKSPISTIGLGLVSSNSVLVLAAGTKGKRFSMPNTRILIHQPMRGTEGSANEVHIQTLEHYRMTRLVIAFYSKFTGNTSDTIEKEIDRENFLTPEKSKDFGIIDEIIR